MKLEDPLLSLVKKCESICVSGCCGVDAYDFSSLHIGSFLIMYSGVVDDQELRSLKEQLSSLSANYGINGASGRGLTLEDMNHKFSAKQLDEMISEISKNLEIALGFISQCEDNSGARHK